MTSELILHPEGQLERSGGILVPAMIAPCR